MQMQLELYIIFLQIELEIVGCIKIRQIETNWKKARLHFDKWVLDKNKQK